MWKYIALNCTVSAFLLPVQVSQEAHSKNGTMLQFLSPTVNRSYESQSFRTFIQLDNLIEELKPFDYHPDPTFNDLPNRVIPENSMIIVTVRLHETNTLSNRFVCEPRFDVSIYRGGFSTRHCCETVQNFCQIYFKKVMHVVQGRGFAKAMTAKEAEAFVGDVSCNVNTLQDDKLFLDPPSTTPRSRSKRQRRDTTSEPLDLLVGSRFTASCHSLRIIFDD